MWQGRCLSVRCRGRSLPIREARDYEASGAPVGRHLADQLLVPMALAGGGSFRSLKPTRHTTTNAEVIGKFLDARVEIASSGEAACTIAVSGRSADRSAP